MPLVEILLVMVEKVVQGLEVVEEVELVDILRI